MLTTIPILKATLSDIMEKRFYLNLNEGRLEGKIVSFIQKNNVNLVIDGGRLSCRERLTNSDVSSSPTPIMEISELLVIFSIHECQKVLSEDVIHFLTAAGGDSCILNVDMIKNDGTTLSMPKFMLSQCQKQISELSRDDKVMASDTIIKSIIICVTADAWSSDLLPRED